MQKLIQVQIQKFLTFEDICPRWSKVFHTQKKTQKTKYRVDRKNLDIEDCKKCVVGEAHGFPNDADTGYKNKDGSTCKKCYKYSVNIPRSLEESPYNRRIRVERFVNHFNQYHV